MRVFFLSVLVMFGLTSAAATQNMSGVFAPVVYADDHGGDEFDCGQRLHYQETVSESLRLRGILATCETTDSVMDLEFVWIEAVWQVTPDGEDYRADVRFERWLRGDGRADEVRSIWPVGKDPQRYSIGRL